MGTCAEFTIREHLMKGKHGFVLMVVAGILSVQFPLNGQSLALKNAQSWQLTGRVQLQHLFNSDIPNDAAKTRQGFRIRRGRLQVKARLNRHIETKFQIEVRDNSPRLKDAEGKLKFNDGLYFRFGQFKVPVWREELRSSSKLFLVERSLAAEFLVDYRLSARSIGVELGKKLKNGGMFAVNYSNGAGEGGREDAGRSKSTFVNNGKLITARLDVPVGKTLKVGVSGALQRAGRKIGADDNTGNITLVAPDFGLYLKAGQSQRIDIEGGLALGKIAGRLSDAGSDQSFTLFEVSGRWHKKLTSPRDDLAGLDAIEFAAGYSLVDEATSVSAFRFGPAAYFGKHARLQINAEIEDGDSSQFRIRSQFTVNF